MLLSVLSEGIGSSCLAHFSSRIKVIYCCYRDHVTMTTEVYRGLRPLKFLFRMPVSGKEAIYNMYCCHENSATMRTETYTLKLCYLKAS